MIEDTKINKVNHQENKNSIRKDRIYIFRPKDDNGYVFLNYNDEFKNDNNDNIFYTVDIDETTWDDDINGEKIMLKPEQSALQTFCREISFANGKCNTYTILVNNDIFKIIQDKIKNYSNKTSKFLELDIKTILNNKFNSQIQDES